MPQLPSRATKNTLLNIRKCPRCYGAFSAMPVVCTHLCVTYSMDAYLMRVTASICTVAAGSFIRMRMPAFKFHGAVLFDTVMSRADRSIRDQQVRMYVGA